MKLKNYFKGVIQEGKRVRWPHGVEFRNDVFTVFGYTIFFALFLILSDALVIELLKVLGFE